MKTITAQQAEEQFGEYAKLAHDGERILVTLEGEPWVMLSPPAILAEAKPPAGKLEWPDFAGRLARYYPQPVEGPTATELLAQEKEDRF
jgi:antitoxin (DNA-binding transcriptional repressor) of toxin-antitoxin stability system